MVVRLQKLNVYDTANASLDEMEPQDQLAHPDVRQEQHRTLLDETVIEEEAEQDITSAGSSTTSTSSSSGLNASESQTSQAEAEKNSHDVLPPLNLWDCSSSLGGDDLHDVSFDEGSTYESPRKSRLGRGRDRSNTWSHSALSLSKAAMRSGSLLKLNGMECALSPAVSRLSLERGDSPFPSTPTCVTPRLGKLLVCSEHRMSTSPRLPPIGHNPQTPVPRNTPRELEREVTLIDPALVEQSDPTDVRMIGRRRNAFMIPSYPNTDEDS